MRGESFFFVVEAHNLKSKNSHTMNELKRHRVWTNPWLRPWKCFHLNFGIRFLLGATWMRELSLWSIGTKWTRKNSFFSSWFRTILLLGQFCSFRSIVVHRRLSRNSVTFCVTQQWATSGYGNCYFLNEFLSRAATRSTSTPSDL